MFQSWMGFHLLFAMSFLLCMVYNYCVEATNNPNSLQNRFVWQHYIQLATAGLRESCSEFNDLWLIWLEIHLRAVKAKTVFLNCLMEQKQSLGYDSCLWQWYLWLIGLVFIRGDQNVVASLNAYKFRESNFSKCRFIFIFYVHWFSTWSAREKAL